jgi:hypothetical protein
MRTWNMVNRGIADKNPLIVSGEQVVPVAKDMGVMKKTLISGGVQCEYCGSVTIWDIRRYAGS